MPLLSLLILVVFGLPDIGLTFSLFTSAALCLAAFGAAFVCEAVRGGINTVPVGQAEAARSLGFTFTQSLRYVILPPAFRPMVQPLVNIFIGIALELVARRRGRASASSPTAPRCSTCSPRRPWCCSWSAACSTW